MRLMCEILFELIPSSPEDGAAKKGACSVLLLAFSP